jgi:hypothetical protein
LAGRHLEAGRLRRALKLIIWRDYNMLISMFTATLCPDKTQPPQTSLNGHGIKSKEMHWRIYQRPIIARGFKAPSSIS